MITVTDTELKDNVGTWLNQASQTAEGVMVVSQGQAKVVLLSVEMYEKLIGIQEPAIMPWGQFQIEFQQALAQAGYTSREDILKLVQDVKREIADERLG